jgi:hypothetical protein
MKQTTISRFSVEAKYHVIAYTTCELLWSHSLLADFGIIIFILTPIYYDNQIDLHNNAHYVFICVLLYL